MSAVGGFTSVLPSYFGDKQHGVISIASIFVCHCDMREYHGKKTGRSEMLVAVNVKVNIVTPSDLADGYQHFGFNTFFHNSGTNRPYYKPRSDCPNKHFPPKIGNMFLYYERMDSKSEVVKSSV
jgi:hypothetical protein